MKDKVCKQDSSYHIVSIVDIAARGGIMLLSLTPNGDGSIPDEDVRIMREIGDWLRVNAEGIYATRPWKTVAEGIRVDQIRKVAFNQRRGADSVSWKFQDLENSEGEAIRFTRSKDYQSLYAFVIGVPQSGKVTIKTLRKGNVAKNGRGIAAVSLLGSDARVDWEQTAEGLTLTFPQNLPCEVAYGFKIGVVGGRIDDTPREELYDPIARRGNWPVFNSTR